MQQGQLPGVLNPREAPDGYFAVLKSVAKPTDGGNICRACDWRPECQKSSTDFLRSNHRCMGCAVISSRDGREIQRRDGCSVVFKRLPTASQEGTSHRLPVGGRHEA